MKNNYKSNISLNGLLALASVLYITNGIFELKQGFDWYIAITISIATMALIVFINMVMQDLNRLKRMKKQ